MFKNSLPKNGIEIVCHEVNDDDEDSHIHPIDFDDLTPHSFHRNNSLQDEGYSSISSPPVSNKYFSVAMGMKKTRKKEDGKKHMVHLEHWKHAIEKAHCLGDPWEKFHLDEFPTEVALRHRYHTLQQTWITDNVLVKINPESFGRGAMRECFRLKKLSNFSHSNNWKTSSNYVAKRYIETVDRNVYFEDVKLQMDAKLWGEEFNRHNPPKKIDIIQVAILEFFNREGSPLYHLEHYIEGVYVKYNSNSGYVSEEMRLTPQAFSHFTFERSGHELIVVDIQGVGDLYTDPQIHTASGKEYNDGNLGTRGMALFFHTHICNTICQKLGLYQFDLAPSELKGLHEYSVHQESDSSTEVKNMKTELCVSFSEKEDWHKYFRRQLSSQGYQSTDSPFNSLSTKSDSVSSQSSVEDDMFIMSSDSNSGPGFYQRTLTESGSVTTEQEKLFFSALVQKKSRASCVMQEQQLRALQENVKQTGGSILGEIHLNLAKYHELCRFSKPGEDIYDEVAAFFHLKHAADCGNLEAILNISRILLHFPHDILVNIELPETEENINQGVEYALIAAKAGDRASMINMAEAYNTGLNLGTEKRQSWTEAVYWYNKAIEMNENDESDEYDGCLQFPLYQLYARQAELYLTGGNQLEKNTYKAGELFQEAADAASAAMKGKLANLYYAKAEEALGELEE